MFFLSLFIYALFSMFSPNHAAKVCQNASQYFRERKKTGEKLLKVMTETDFAEFICSKAIEEESPRHKEQCASKRETIVSIILSRIVLFCCGRVTHKNKTAKTTSSNHGKQRKNKASVQGRMFFDAKRWQRQRETSNVPFFQTSVFNEKQVPFRAAQRHTSSRYAKPP